MSKSVDVIIAESDGGEAERAIKQTILNLKILEYLDSTLQDMSHSGEALNQCVIFFGDSNGSPREIY